MMEIRCMNCKGVLVYTDSDFHNGYLVEECERCAILIKEEVRVIAVAMQTRRQRCCGESEEDCKVCLELDCWITEILECFKKG